MDSTLAAIASAILSLSRSCNLTVDTSSFNIFHTLLNFARLDTLGAAGVFDGEEAVSAMATDLVYENRLWSRWYNSPGSYHIVKRFRLLESQTSSPDSAHSSVQIDHAALFGSNTSKGPKFTALYSGTVTEETGHVAALLMKHCAALGGIDVGGPVEVTLAKLKVPNSQPQRRPCRTHPYSLLFAGLSTGVSAGTCVMCGICGDWYASLSIFCGILASGISSLAIGSAKLALTHPDASQRSSPGDGIFDSGEEIVLLTGEEDAVKSITHGRFCIRFPGSVGRFKTVLRSCSVLLTLQFVIQLLLFPKCSPFGRRMFAASLAASWMYNSSLSFVDKEQAQLDILRDSVFDKKLVLTKYTLGTRITAVVFILLVLQPREPEEILLVLLPNDSEVWIRWREMIVERLGAKERQLKFSEQDWNLETFSENQKSLLRDLYGDAEAAWVAYNTYREESQGTTS